MSECASKLSQKLAGCVCTDPKSIFILAFFTLYNAHTYCSSIFEISCYGFEGFYYYCDLHKETGFEMHFYFYIFVKMFPNFMLL